MQHPSQSRMLTQPFSERSPAKAERRQDHGTPHPVRDVDDLFHEMDNLAREREESRTPLREKGRRLSRQARSCVAEALRHNDPGHDVWRVLQRPVLDRALRDLLASGGISAERVPEGEAAPEPQRTLAAALERAEPPEEYFRITEAMSGKVSNAARVAEAVASNPVLAAMLLRLVNSPFYGLGSRVESLQRAVAFAGFNELSALALSVSALRRYAVDREDRSERHGFWRRSVLCGVLARLLARRTGQGGQWFFVAGLLHDVGGLLARQEVPMRFAMLSRSLRLGGAEREAAEREHLGVSTAHLGGSMLRRWGVAESLAALVQGRRSPDAGDKAGCVLHLAEVLAASLCAALPGALPVPPLRGDAWEALGMSAGELPGLLEQAQEEAAGLLCSLRA